VLSQNNRQGWGIIGLLAGMNCVFLSPFSLMAPSCFFAGYSVGFSFGVM